MTVSERLLEILVCPLCKEPLDQVETNNDLQCGACQLRFPVRNDIPVMLVDEAEKLTIE